MRGYSLQILVLLGALVLGAPPARTATVIPLSLERMERLSSDVVLGTVEDTRAAWDRDHRLIETHVRIRVERRIKGQGGPVVNVVVPGGVIGEIGMKTPGAPAFQGGERVLLLAEPKRAGEMRPVGLFQGKLAVKKDASGADVVEPPGPAWGSRGEPLPAGAMPPGAIPALALDEVIRRLGGRP
jgi:hypothetical protein